MFRDFIKKLFVSLNISKIKSFDFWWNLFKIDKLLIKIGEKINVDNILTLIVDKLVPKILSGIGKLPGISDKYQAIKDKMKPPIKNDESPQKTKETLNQVNDNPQTTSTITEAVKHISGNIIGGLTSNVNDKKLTLKKSTSSEKL